jgi:hypothetical protein
MSPFGEKNKYAYIIDKDWKKIMLAVESSASSYRRAIRILGQGLFVWP